MDANGLELSGREDDSPCREIGLYPDIIQMGGLSAAMSALGNEHVLDLGDLSSLPLKGKIKPALVRSENGSISVVAGMERRSFSIGISAGGHLLASGMTDSLLDVIRVADAWRKGIALQSLELQFPFMNIEPLAKAFEGGTEAAFRWGELLQDSALDEIRPLLMAVQRDRVLGQFLPSVSHLVLLRLELDSADSAAGAILISKAADRGFAVDATWVEGAANHVESIEGALEAANLLLRDRD
jgi:hypothetical protein